MSETTKAHEVEDPIERVELLRKYPVMNGNCPSTWHGYACTRDEHHEGDHVAHGGADARAIWPAAPAPVTEPQTLREVIDELAKLPKSLPSFGAELAQPSTPAPDTPWQVVKHPSGVCVVIDSAGNHVCREVGQVLAERIVAAINGEADEKKLWELARDRAMDERDANQRTITSLEARLTEAERLVATGFKRHVSEKPRGGWYCAMCEGEWEGPAHNHSEPKSCPMVALAAFLAETRR